MIEEFERHLRGTNLSENTVTSYLFAVRQFGERHDAVTKCNLKEHKAWLIEQYKPKTVNLRIRAINCYLESIGKDSWKLSSIKVQELGMGLGVADAAAADHHGALGLADGFGSVSQSGLDLEVLDRSTGQARDVSTLSGGESFLASLALALGLSDAVQSQSGQIRMDAMFIDEGFGSLDENALRSSIDVLLELADGKRLIGIISHVQELEERIDKQIVVTKTPNGSTVRMNV